MRTPDPNLHDALRAVVHANVPHLRGTSCRTENWLVTLLARRARQLAAAGSCRQEILERLLGELAGPDPIPAPVPAVQPPRLFGRILRSITEAFRR